VVEAAAGADVVNIEIRLTQSGHGGPARSLTVSGAVMGAPEGARPSVILRYGESEDRLNSSRSTSTGPDGKFSISGLQPGFYRIYAQYSTGKTALQSQAIDTRLDSADAVNLQLILAPGEDLNGTVEFVGDATPSTPAGKISVRLATADNSFYVQDSLSGDVAKDGGFRISNVPPGKYHAVVEPMPENGYLKSVVVDGTASPDDTLDLSHGARGSRVKITVSRNGGRLSGRVLDKNGEPVASSMVMVFLAKDVKQLQDGDMTRVSEAKYEIKAIRPGKYHLIAVDALQLAASAQASDEEAMLKKLFDLAEEIEIKEGDRITKDLTAVDKMPDKEPAHAPANR